MKKPFRTPFSLANVVLTNLLGDWNYQPEAPWEQEASLLAQFISNARIREDEEIFGGDQKLAVIVNVWTGEIREATKEEKRASLEIRLAELDRERKEIKKTIKLLSDKPAPFNLKRFKEGEQ